MENAAADQFRANSGMTAAQYSALVLGLIFMPPAARFVHLLNLPEGANVGQAINDVMVEIEKHNQQLAGVLPRSYQIFTSALLKELLKEVSEIPVSLDYDAFGRIYEYFLGEFAHTEGQKGWRVLYAQLYRAPAGRSDRTVPRAHHRPRLRLRRHVRAECALRVRAPAHQAPSPSGGGLGWGSARLQPR